MNRARLLITFLALALLVASGMIGVLSPFLYKSSIAASTSCPNPNQCGTLRLTLVGDPTTLNQLNASVNQLTGAICVSCWQIITLENSFGLPVLQNGTYNMKASLFSSISSNPSATVWNFTIRPGAKWSDGTPITSADINYTFGLQSGYIAGTGYDFISLLNVVSSVQIVNSSTTEFILNNADAGFGSLLSSQYYFAPVPMHVWQNVKNPGDNLSLGPDVTSGPFYQNSTYTPGSSQVLLVANPYYWDPANVSDILVNFVQNASVAAAQLQAGETDLAMINPSSITSFQGNSMFGLNVEPDRHMLYLEYNTTDSPFNNIAFRVALADSINTNAIVQSVYNGEATPGYAAGGLIPPSATMWHNTSDTQYSYNLALAMGNLTSLGFTQSGGKLLYPNGTTAVSFTIYTDTNNTGDLQAAQMVQSDLKALNMSVNVISEPLSTLDEQYTFSRVTSTFGNTNITSQLVVASTSLPIFGLGYIDVRPAYENYFPWSASDLEQPNWILPSNIETEYNSLVANMNSSAGLVLSQLQQSVSDIDGLNAQYLPLIVLAYPDTIWAYSNSTLTGFLTANAALGFDMGSYYLNPAVFSSIHCITAQNCPSYTVTTTSSSTSSSTSSTSSPSKSTAPPNYDILLILAIVVVLVLIAFGTYATRRRRKKQ